MGGTSPHPQWDAEDSTANYEDYVVKSGDTLWNIANDRAKELGMSVPELVDKIYKENTEQFGASDDEIQVGKRLRIPKILQDIEHKITSKDVGRSLDKLISHYYKDWLTLDRSERAKKIAAHPRNKDIAIGDDYVIPEGKAGLKLYLPNVGPEVGYSVEIPYDFYRPNLWLSRIPSIIDSITSTLDLFLDSLVKIDGISEEFVRDISYQIDTRLEGQEEEKIGHWLNENVLEKILIELDLLLLKLKRIHAPPGFLNLGEEKLRDRYDHLQSLVAYPTGRWSPDPEFEFIQLLNLYTFCCSLLHFVSEPLLMRIASLLPGYWQEKHFRKHPPINLIDESLSRVSVDVEIIQRAIVQRRRSQLSDSDGRYPMTIQARTLLIADKLAIKALAPFQRKLSDQDNERILPITYFSERTHIRRVPYMKNVILIGITYAHISRNESLEELVLVKDIIKQMMDELAEPTQSQSSKKMIYWPAFELMAIPHEVGHFIFHHAKLHSTSTEDNITFAELTKKFITDTANEDSKRYAHWCEEIFADVYGCVIAGPLTAMGMQALSAAKSEQKMIYDDGEHPVPILRPFTISEILRVLTKKLKDKEKFQFPKIPEKLDENWENILRLRGYIPADKKLNETNLPSGRHKFTVSEVQEAIRPIIELYIDKLIPVIKDWSEIPWSGDHDKLENYDKEMEDLTGTKFAKTKLCDHTVNLTKMPAFSEYDYLKAKFYGSP